MAERFQIWYEATKEAVKLFDEVLSGREVESYRLQLNTYQRHGRPLGRSHIIIKRVPHHVWVDVYVSEKRKSIYPLMYHFVRKGEPTENYERELNAILEELQRLEALTPDEG